MFGAIDPYLLPYIKSGNLSAIAVTADKRAEAFPYVPTMKEAGTPDFVMVNWFGVFAPAGTPNEVLTILNRDFVQALQSPDVKGSMRQQALDVGANSRQEFQNFWSKQIAEFQRVIDAVGLTKK